MQRSGDRSHGQHRAVQMVPGFQRSADGSVLYRAGGTVVLCTVSVDKDVPKWMGDQPGGWLTAEYQMHPRASPERRQSRDGRGRALKGRTQEIQRLVGRSLRSALALEAMSRCTITVDCDVLEADGGTRTAAITGGFVALALALQRSGLAVSAQRAALRDQVAAVSVGYVDGEVRVDLDYAEDVAARVDMNVAATPDGRLIEVQSTAEGAALDRGSFEAMLDAALEAIGSLAKAQRQTLAEAGIDLERLMGSSPRAS